MFKELVLINSPQVGLEPTTNRLTGEPVYNYIILLLNKNNKLVKFYFYF